MRFPEDDIETAVVAALRSLKGNDVATFSDFPERYPAIVDIAVKTAIKEPDCLKDLQWADVWDRRKEYPWCRAGDDGPVLRIDDLRIPPVDFFARRDFQVFKEKP